MLNTKPKMKQCYVCKTYFYPRNTLVKCCGYKCAIEFSKLKLSDIAAKEQRKAKKEGLEKLKTKSDWLKEVQKEFNKYIRLRDKNQKCISCDCIIKGIGHASHYFSVGSSPNLRFNEDNVHLSCVECNLHLHGNIAEYSIRLPFRIGVKNFDLLVGNRNEKKHYSIEELKELKEIYKEKIKQIQ